MCLLTTFLGPDSRGTMECNGRLGLALAFFDLVKNYLGTASWSNGRAALRVIRKVTSSLEGTLFLYFPLADHLEWNRKVNYVLQTGLKLPTSCGPGQWYTAPT